MAADRIQIAEPAPAHCSSCYQQKPQQRHVDFGAAYDGPVVPALGNVAGAVGHTIDELIICEDCLTIAARLIGLENTTEIHERLQHAEETRDRLLERVAALEEHNQHLRQAVSSGQQVERVMRPPALTPKPVPGAPPLNSVEKALAEKQRLEPAKPRRRAKPDRSGRRQSAAGKAAAAQEDQK